MDILSYVLSKKYIEDSLNGVGALAGKSAYEIAVKHGFEGSEQEWLESLKTDIPEIKGVVKYEEQSLTDEQKVQVQKNIGFGEEDAIELATDTGLVSPVSAEDGSIYTDENGALYTL